MHAARAVQRSSRDQNQGQNQRLRGGWLLVARIAWVAIALLAVVDIVVSFPAEFARLQHVCAAARCPTSTLDLANMRQLEALGRSVNFFASTVIALEITFALVACVVGGALFWRKSDDGMALFAALMLVTFGAQSFAGSFDAVAAQHPGWWWAFASVFFLGNISPVLFLFVFPTGRFVPGWTRMPAALLVVLGVGFHFFPDALPFRWLSSPAGTVFSLGILALAVWSQVYRYRRVSDTEQRQQTKWVVWGAALAIAGSQAVPLLLPLFGRPHVLAIMAGHAILTMSVLLIPLSIGIAILRHRLWNIDMLIGRTLVYGLLTASVVGIYVFVVGYLGALFQTSGNLAISLVATGLVAVLFQPLRERLQRGVSHLLYGTRDEPYTVLANFGQRLDGATDSAAVLATIVATVRDALRLPYAAIILDQEGRAALAAATGSPVANPLRMPLLYQGEAIGQLILGPRGLGETFDAADRRLIAVLAGQAGVAAHAVRLTSALQRSREQLVLAREEERRRLRNDLHDGLGPRLASLTLNMQTARMRLAHDPQAEALLAELIGQTQAAVADIRRVVYDLRPPSLDELGLLSALHEIAAQFQAHANNLQIHVDIPAQVAPLPAAVEVAAYRIAQEALTNVLKHARAQACWLRLEVDWEAGALHLSVRDDGNGIGAQHHVGVGLGSMRERAIELGGTLTIEPLSAGGTLVRARLPIAS